MSISQKFFHGGAPGLTPGDLVLPPSITNAKKRKIKGESKYRADRVYITPNLKFALFFAAWHNSGHGVVYEVEPIGVVEDDPDWDLIRSATSTSYNETKQCESAHVLGIVDVSADLFAEARGVMMQGSIAAAQQRLTAARARNRRGWHHRR